MKVDQILAMLTSRHDQDLMNGDAWFDKSSNEDVMKVWDRIQEDGADVVDEIVKRFAQIGFQVLYFRYAERAGATNDD